MAPSSLPHLQLPPSPPPYELDSVSGIISRLSPTHPSLPRPSVIGAKKCVHTKQCYNRQHHRRNHRDFNHNNSNNNSCYDQHRQRRQDYSNEEHQYLASEDEDENYDYERLKRYRNRLSSRRISPGTMNRVNLLVKRFLCFLACPSLRSSVRYSQDC